MKNPFLLFVICLIAIFPAKGQHFFEPLIESKTLNSKKAEGKITIDGRLNEADWLNLAATVGFVEVDPNQGTKSYFVTEVKVLFDNTNLYIAAYCKDTLGKKGIRVPDLRRDFDYYANDIFGVSIDPFLDKRNAIIFQTNPYGAQRDVLSFDDALMDREWDGLWKVRTQILDSGWTAEIAIPWSTLRYSKQVLEGWGINFVRRVRRVNTLSSWSPFPRAFTPYRMSYAGILKGLSPPPPSTNIRVQPYILGDATRITVNDSLVKEDLKPKIGGEIKWAINPQSVLDVTVNTDFAQADADRQVNNLTRFSVFFPERRQFFLESASVFSGGLAQSIQPFFSRRVGLDETGTPLAIDGGLRFIQRTQKRVIGGLAMRQKSDKSHPASWFGVGRFSQNIGKQNRIGGIITARHDERIDTSSIVTNLVGAVDGFFRLSQPVSVEMMGSASKTDGAKGDGYSGYAKITYNSNWLVAWHTQSIISKEYNPAVGFIYNNNVVNTSPNFYFNYRPKWKPKYVRSFEPGVFGNIYHNAATGSLQQYEFIIFPIWIQFQDGGVFETNIIPTRQILDLSFFPLGTAIAPGTYQYNRYKLSYKSDASRKLGGTISYETGNYYNGKLETIDISLRIAPIPHLYFLIEYQRNRLNKIGEKLVTKTADLITPQVRLAINPRIQLTGFYQMNTAVDRSVWNLRFSWEFKPLSYLYLVYNNSNLKIPAGTSEQQQIIGKITYLKQF